MKCSLKKKNKNNYTINIVLFKRQYFTLLHISYKHSSCDLNTSFISINFATELHAKRSLLVPKENSYMRNVIADIWLKNERGKKFCVCF